MNLSKSMAPREITPGQIVDERPRAARSLLALLVVVVTSSGLLSMSGCRQQSQTDEAIEEIQDELKDAKEEVEDEIDDHT